MMPAGLSWASTFRRSSSRSFGDGSPDSPGNQGRGIGQNTSGRKAAGTRQITRLPMGRKLLFVLSQTTKIVKALAAPEDQSADSVPQRCQSPRIKPREGSDPQAEGAEAPFHGPQ